MQRKPKILVILGPTASGKSALAVKLARRLNGEIISADSRQVYRGLDIGSGKITRAEMKGVPHHLLDIADPKKIFTVDLFGKLAHAAIADILSRGKLPIVCGGTAFYIQAIVDSPLLPDVQPDPKLRARLAKKPAAELHRMLAAKDPARAKMLDPRNPVRLIRALEIVATLGSVAPLVKNQRYEAIQIGMAVDPEILRKKIAARLRDRLRKGMVAEARRLHEKGLSWKRMEMLGLEYRSLARFLQRKITRQELIEGLEADSWNYVRRQLQWWRKDARIAWIRPSGARLLKSALSGIVSE